jgi:hypothetical protein
MRPRNVLQIATLAVLCALALFAPAWGELVLYDDFGDPSARVRSDLWFGTEAFTGDLLDSVRATDHALQLPEASGRLIVGRRLHFRPSPSPTGGGPIGSDTVRYSTREDATAIGVQARVVLLTCAVPDGGFAQARMLHSAFIGQRHPGTGLPLVLGAILGIRCPSPAPPELFYQLFQCGDVPCSANLSRLVADVPLGPAILGREYTLYSRRGATGVELFVDGAPVATHEVVPADPGPVPAAQRFAQIGTRLQLPSAEAGGDLEIIAIFDDVMLERE